MKIEVNDEFVDVDDGMSVAGLGRLAGAARQDPLDSTARDSVSPARDNETAGSDEMPVLRPSGR